MGTKMTTSWTSDGSYQAARTVVYRHECECANASGPLPADGEAVHRFDVDGKPFPWLITEQGANFMRLPDGVGFLVAVTIIPYDTDMGCHLEFHHCGYEHPLIGGVEFPWLLHGAMSYTYGQKLGPLLSLQFFADAVDTDAEIVDAGTY